MDMTWRSEWLSKRWRSIPACGRSTGSTRGGWRPASRRCTSITVRREPASPTICATRFRVIERSDPAQLRRFLKGATEEARKRYAVYQQLAGITVPRAEVMDEEIEPKEAEK